MHQRIGRVGQFKMVASERKLVAHIQERFAGQKSIDLNRYRVGSQQNAMGISQNDGMHRSKRRVVEANGATFAAAKSASRRVQSHPTSR